VARQRVEGRPQRDGFGNGIPVAITDPSQRATLDRGKSLPSFRAGNHGDGGGLVSGPPQTEQQPLVTRPPHG